MNLKIATVRINALVVVAIVATGNVVGHLAGVPETVLTAFTSASLVLAKDIVQSDNITDS